MILKDNISISALAGHTKFKNKIDQNLMDFLSLIKDESMRNSLKSALFPGRRLRPTLFFLLVSPTSNQKDIQSLSNFALAIELCHRSSIIIDDLVDHDDVRRQHLAHHKKFGEDQTIVLSHYLISAAYKQIQLLPKKLQNPAYHLFSDTYQKMAIGQLADIGAIKSGQNYLSLYKETALGKTSALFELVFKVASIFRSLNSQESNLLGNLGIKFGQLYQIYNDIYDDLLSTDIERGDKKKWKINLTLVNSYLLDHGTKAEKKIVFNSLGKNCSIDQFNLLRNKMRSQKCIDFAVNYGENFYSEVMDAIEQVPHVDIKQTILMFAEWLRQKKCWNQKEFANAGY